MIHHINKKKHKNHIIISIDAEKAFNKVHLFMIKTFTKVGLEETHINIVKAIDEEPPANILNGEKQSFSHNIKSMTGMSTFTSAVQYSTGSPCLSNQTTKRKSIQISKEEAKLSLFSDHMILHVENLKDSTKKLLELIQEFSKVTG